LDNTEATLSLSASTGDWKLANGGVIRDGTVKTADGTELLAQSGTLDGATIEGNISVGGSGFLNLAIENGLTLNGTLRVPLNTRITFGEGAQTLDGEGEVILGGFIDQIVGNVLSLGPDVLVTGSGTFGRQASGTAIINQGTIRANVSGEDLNIRTSVFTNEGTVEAIGGGILELGGQWGNTGTLRVSGGVLQLGGEFSTADIGTVDRVGGPVELTGTGRIDGCIGQYRGDPFAVCFDRRLEIGQRRSYPGRNSYNGRRHNAACAKWYLGWCDA
jgi:hypothetical protein